jgi:hypothetical protein
MLLSGAAGLAAAPRVLQAHALVASVLLAPTRTQMAAQVGRLTESRLTRLAASSSANARTIASRAPLTEAASRPGERRHAGRQPGAVRSRAGPQAAGGDVLASSRAARSRVCRPRHQKNTPTTMNKSTGSSSVHR